jgi:predicted Zn-dependent protease
MLEAMNGPVQLQRLVRSYLEEGRLMEALVVAKKGAAEFPAFVVEFHLQLAEAYVAGGKHDSARMVLEATQAAHPDELRIREALALLRK